MRRLSRLTFTRQLLNIQDAPNFTIIRPKISKMNRVIILLAVVLAFVAISRAATSPRQLFGAGLSYGQSQGGYQQSGGYQQGYGGGYYGGGGGGYGRPGYGGYGAGIPYGGSYGGGYGSGYQQGSGYSQGSGFSAGIGIGRR